MREERRRMEEPANRRAAEEAASRARREADRITRELEKDGSRPSYSSVLKSQGKQHGDSVLGPDGRVDYTSAPQVKAPEGMKAVITIKNNCWDVSFENKD
jgi:hypothetical protein